MTNVEIIQGLYEAFGRGDLEAILARIAPKVDWSDTPPVAGADLVPMFKNLHTPAEVAEGYFGPVATGLDFDVFEPTAFYGDGDRVAVVLEVGATVQATGKRFEMTEVHLWTLADGLIVKYRNVLDTAQIIAAYTPN